MTSPELANPSGAPPFNRSETFPIKPFLAAWLGWTFDGLDGFLYGLVAIPFVKELLGKGASVAEITTKAALIQAVFLVGWALGGAVFGRVGDRLGRAKTLNLTILLYAVCTGLSFFSGAWWHLMLFRFFAALGIGGEWAAGSALVAETLPNRFRHWASAALQSGYIVGIIASAVTVGALGAYSPRYVFLVGVLPAILTLWIRKTVPEPEAWKLERGLADDPNGEIDAATPPTDIPKFSALFKPPVLSTTIFTLLTCAIALTSIWALLFFSTQVIKAIPEVAALPPVEQAKILRHVTIVYCLWNIAGNFGASALAAKVGYRAAFASLFFLSFLTYFLGFGAPHSLATTQNWLSATMFFGSGVFALFPLYIPPLFPVLLRTTGSGLCYNFGRLTAAVGTLIGGTVAASAGGPHLAIYYAGFLYLPGIALVLLVKQPRPVSEG